MREVCIAGVGMHPFGRFDDKPYWALGQQAALMALEDARMEWREIQQAFSSTLRVPLAAGTRILLPLGRTAFQYRTWPPVAPPAPSACGRRYSRYNRASWTAAS